MNANAHSSKHHDARCEDARAAASLALDGRALDAIFPRDESLTRAFVDYLH